MPTKSSSANQVTKSEVEDLERELEEKRKKAGQIRAQLVEISHDSTRRGSDLEADEERCALVEEGARVTARIEEIRRLLDSGEIIEEDCAGREIGAGSTVEVLYLTGPMAGRRVTRTITSNSHPNCGTIGVDTPLAKALKDRCPGDEVAFQTASGATLQVRIL